MSVIAYASPAWEFAAGSHLEIQRLQGKVLRITGKVARLQGAYRPASCTWLSKFHTYDVLYKIMQAASRSTT
jgi:hypothetical protein